MSTIILGIESSCDDTSAAVIKDGYLLSNVVASQAVHEAYGGVVPELASRAHQQNIVPVVHEALKRAGVTKEELSAVAFTRGPGLMGSLLVGVSFAKGFARALGIPMIDVNHLTGHVLAHFIKAEGEENVQPEFPFLCLLVSGGNSQIILVKAYNDMEILGQTIDDAAGEAIDKCSKVMGLGYPGGPRGFERKEECAQVILATGGVSYPATGSTGDGYAFAADLGHTIEPLRPSLTPLLSSHAQMRYLDKVLLRNVRATLYVDNEPVREEFGEIGFSDRGIEGAVALRMSRDAVDALIEEKRVKLVLDLKPALTEEVLHERIAREIAELQPNEFFGELLRKLVPKPLVMPLAQEVDIRANCYVGKITEEQITRLVRTLKGLTFPITDYAPFEYAVVTAGGVRCDEVNPYTMESLKVKGLYFAGEVLDIDANTGGYNLQIAFSTGRLAGSLKK